MYGGTKEERGKRLAEADRIFALLHAFIRSITTV
jgi:hypothetical protein